MLTKLYFLLLTHSLCNLKSSYVRARFVRACVIYCRSVANVSNRHRLLQYTMKNTRLSASEFASAKLSGNAESGDQAAVRPQITRPLHFGLALPTPWLTLSALTLNVSVGQD